MGLVLEHFKSAISAVIDIGLINYAPMGASGNHIVLSRGECGSGERVSQVSIRLHNSQVDLLVTNACGDFLYYGKWHKRLGVDFISKQHYEVWCILKEKLLQDSVQAFEKVE